MKGHLDRSRLQRALELLSSSFEVVAPMRVEADDDAPRLEGLRPETLSAVALEPRKPLLPLKTLFLPESEQLFRYGSDGAIAAAAPLARDRLVLGALPCDLAALTLLDRVFLADPVDQVYGERRERTTLVALACAGEGPECFCASAAVDLARPANADAVLAPTPDGFSLEPLTGKGERVAELLEELLREPDVGAPPVGFPACRADIPMTGLPTWSELWDAALWGELAARCLGCGVCTLTCPTCHCFDVQDERLADGGARLRAWDSCMFCEFTRMASGENPRAAREARVRQRFLHKLAYIRERYNTFGCVGCGRCTRLCPVGIGIEEVIAALDAAGRPR